MPILSDLHQALLDQHLPEADRVAQALDLYVSGSLNVFNHKTNVDIHNRLVAFDIKELGKQLKKLGLLIIQDQIWGRVTQNRSQGRATWYFADEFHLLLKEEQTAAYSAAVSYTHLFKVLFLRLKEARRSVHTAPGFLHTEP